MPCGGGKDAGEVQQTDTWPHRVLTPHGRASKRSAPTLSAAASAALPGELWVPDLLAQDLCQWRTRQSEPISLGGGRLGKEKGGQGGREGG